MFTFNWKAEVSSFLWSHAVSSNGVLIASSISHQSFDSCNVFLFPNRPIGVVFLSICKCHPAVLAGKYRPTTVADISCWIEFPVQSWKSIYPAAATASDAVLVCSSAAAALPFKWRMLLQIDTEEKRGKKARGKSSKLLLHGERV